MRPGVQNTNQKRRQFKLKLLLSTTSFLHELRQIVQALSAHTAHSNNQRHRHSLRPILNSKGRSPQRSSLALEALKDSQPGRPLLWPTCSPTSPKCAWVLPLPPLLLPANTSRGWNKSCLRPIPGAAEPPTMHLGYISELLWSNKSHTYLAGFRTGPKL